MIHKPCLTLKITKDEVKLFSYVLEKGLDMDRMIEICFTEHDKIKDALQAGNSLRRVLFSNQKNVYFQTILVLSSSMSLKMAIDCANRIEEQLQNIFKNFFQNLTYPFCIFIFSYLMILFFSYSIVPQMIMFHEERSFVFLDILKIIYTIVFVGLILFLLIYVLYLQNTSLRKRWYPYLTKQSLFRQFQTVKFSFIFHALLNCHLSTKSCFEILTSFTFYPDIQMISQTIYQALEAGVVLKDVIKQENLDPLFVRFFHIGIQKNDLSSCLTLYQEQAKLHLQQQVKRLTKILQAASYLCVGLLVLVVYQIVLVPLNMLTTM